MKDARALWVALKIVRFYTLECNYILLRLVDRGAQWDKMISGLLVMRRSAAERNKYIELSWTMQATKNTPKQPNTP